MIRSPMYSCTHAMVLSAVRCQRLGEIDTAISHYGPLGGGCTYSQNPVAGGARNPGSELITEAAASSASASIDASVGADVVVVVTFAAKFDPARGGSVTGSSLLWIDKHVPITIN